MQTLVKQRQRVNKDKQQKQKRKPKKKRVPQPTDVGAQMSSLITNGYGATLRTFPSVLAFASVYTDPWLTSPARLPMLPLMPSKLARYFVSGTGVVSTSGYAWVAALPESMAVNSTNTVWVNKDTSGPAFLSGGSLNPTPNSPYTFANFEYNQPNSLAIRVVAFGIRIRYTGTILQASGDWYAVQMNPRQTISGIDAAGIQKFSGNKTGKFTTGDYVGYTRMITSPSDFVYMQNILGTGWCDATTGTLLGKDDVPYIGMLASGSPGQPYEYEVVMHCELVGPNLDYTAVSQSHTQKVEDVVNAYTKKRHQDRVTKDHTMGAFDKVKSIGKDLLSLVEKEFPVIGTGAKILSTLFK